MPEELAIKPLTGYDESLIPQSKQLYNLTWLEYASKNYQQSVKATRTTGGTGKHSIYIVPEGHTLFITSYYLQQLTKDGGALLLSGFIQFGNLGNLQLSGINSDETNGGFSCGLSSPLQIREGEEIYISSSHADLYISGGFTGFLVAKK